MVSTAEERPLEWQIYEAVKSDNINILKPLVGSVVDINERFVFDMDHLGLKSTILGLAARLGSARVVDLLVKLGADVTIPDEWSETTPLMWACKHNYVESARLILGSTTLKEPPTYPGDINAMNKTKRTALDFASHYGSPEVVALLMSHPDIDCNIPDKYDNTRLMCACLNGQVEMARLLVAKTRDINKRNMHRQTALDNATNPEGEGDASRKAEIVEMLLAQEGININITDTYGDTALMRACLKGDLKMVNLLLFKSEVHDINLSNNNNRTALSFACESGSKSVVEALLEKKNIDIDVADSDGQTPVMWACKCGHKEVFELFFNGKLHDVNLKSNSKRTMLSFAAASGNENIVNLLLDIGGIDVDALDEDGRSALMWASKCGHKSVVESLLPKTKNINNPDKDGHTTMMLACQLSPHEWKKNAEAKHNRAEIVKLILGRTDLHDMNFRNKHKSSAFFIVCENGHEDIVKILLDRNDSDINLTGGELHNTPLMIAAKNGYIGIVDKLLRHQRQRVHHLALENREGHTALDLALNNERYDVAERLLQALLPKVGKVTQQSREESFLFKHNNKLLIEHLAPHLTEQVAIKILLADRPFDWDGIPISTHSYSWNAFLDSKVPGTSSFRQHILQALCHLFDCSRAEFFRHVAFTKDQHGREILQTTDAETRKFLKKELFFCGRYDIFEGPPIHVSATSVVIHAFDHDLCDQMFDVHSSDGGFDIIAFKECTELLGRLSASRHVVGQKKIASDKKEWENEFKVWAKGEYMTKEDYLRYCEQHFGGKIKVAMKFLSSQSACEAEVENRKRIKCPNHVLDLYPTVDATKFQEDLAILKSKVTQIDLADASHFVVMPAADRTLEDIHNKEKPNELHTRGYLLDVATDLNEMHKRGYVHGDVKKLNVVRTPGNSLKLIDLDATTKIGEPIGIKFSSGILPPEMFYRLKGEEVQQYENYWENEKEDRQLWKKLKPNKNFVVKSFRRDKMNALPYELVKATPAVDAWSFGCMVYEMLSGNSLVQTDVNQDMVGPPPSWDENELENKVSTIHDERAKKLVLKLLVKDPSKRITMEQVIKDAYFNDEAAYSEFETQFANVIEGQDRLFEKVARVQEEVQTTAEVGEAARRSLRGATTAATNAVVNVMFDVTKIPTSFVLLEDALRSEDESNGVETYIPTYEDNEIKLPTLGSPRYLYFVDEITGEIVEDSGMCVANEWFAGSVDSGLESANQLLSFVTFFTEAFPSVDLPEEKQNTLPNSNLVLHGHGPVMATLKQLLKENRDNTFGQLELQRIGDKLVWTTMKPSETAIIPSNDELKQLVTKKLLLRWGVLFQPDEHGTAAPTA
ncbi:unnamed protein product [Aphanomyces euteiches]